MADSFCSCRPRPITATSRPARALACSQVVGELADSVGGSRPRKNTHDEKTCMRCYTQSGRGQIGVSAAHGEIISSR